MSKFTKALEKHRQLKDLSHRPPGASKVAPLPSLHNMKDRRESSEEPSQEAQQDKTAETTVNRVQDGGRAAAASRVAEDIPCEPAENGDFICWDYIDEVEETSGGAPQGEPVLLRRAGEKSSRMAAPAGAQPGRRTMEGAREKAKASAVQQAAEPRAKQQATVKKGTPKPPGGKPATPARRFRVDRDLISLTDPHSVESELFRALRSKILFPLDGRPCRSVMVTSAASGEGKSFVAANLAVNLARNIDHHVLLMDCDLREPSVHRKFGFRNVKGLSDYLANGIGLAPLLLKTGINKLTLLPAGRPPENPAEILSSAKMEALLDEVMARYDDRYIIIDAPPPLVVPDTSAIAKKVDGILLVVRHAKTDYAILEDLVDEVGKDKIIGAVINQCKMRSSKNYGYSRYSKYGKYGRRKK